MSFMSLLGENPCQNSNEIKELSSGDRTIIYDFPPISATLTLVMIGQNGTK